LLATRLGPGVNVLQVIPALNDGGAERTTLEVAEALVRAGGTATVASAGGRLEGELAALGGTLARGPYGAKNPLVIRSNADRLADLARATGAQLIHARSRAPAWSALWAARRLGLPFVTTYHGFYRAKGPLKRLYNSAMARGDVVIANSSFTADHVRAEHPFAAKNVVVIPRGVDLSRFDPAAVALERRETLLRAWGLDASDARPRILLPGRISRWKGQDVLIDALAVLKGQGRYALGLCVGGADGRDAILGDLKARAAAAGVDVRFPGSCADMPAAYSLADVVVCPSTEPEPFGRTAVEAQAMGAPVIAADHGGARETVAPGVTGWLTPPGDATALAAALSEALAMPAERCADMARAARTRVVQHFSKESLQKATLDVYARLLEAV
jgi:glycosyltransferase involved in cell wall biosynthesis